MVEFDIKKMKTENLFSAGNFNIEIAVSTNEDGEKYLQYEIYFRKNKVKTCFSIRSVVEYLELDDVFEEVYRDDEFRTKDMPKNFYIQPMAGCNGKPFVRVKFKEESVKLCDSIAEAYAFINGEDEDDDE